MGFHAAPGGEFPFRLGGEPETVAALGIECGDESLHLFPGLARDGDGGVGIVGGLAHHAIPHVLGDLGLRKIETPGQGHSMDRPGVLASHLEGAGDDIIHVQTIYVEIPAVDGAIVAIPFVVAIISGQIGPTTAAWR